MEGSSDMGQPLYFTVCVCVSQCNILGIYVVTGDGNEGNTGIQARTEEISPKLDVYMFGLQPIGTLYYCILCICAIVLTILLVTRRLGALRAPTSNWWPFGPA